MVATVAALTGKTVKSRRVFGGRLDFSGTRNFDKKTDTALKHSSRCR